MAAQFNVRWLADWGQASPTVTWSFAELDLTQALSTFVTGPTPFSGPIAAPYRALVQKAADAWEAVANIDLVLVPDSIDADIRVGNRSIDGAAAPGQSSIVGQTQLWGRGTIASYAEVAFDTDAYSGSIFYEVAVHEFGHALGLDHSQVEAAVMYARINGFNRDGVLLQDDIKSIQKLYGERLLPTADRLKLAFTNVLRVDPTSPDALSAKVLLADGSSADNPLYTVALGLNATAGVIDAGYGSYSGALAEITRLAAPTTSVAALSYQFFTGKTPTAAGLDWLVHSSANANDLNDAYYARFNLENRFINFAVNLGKLGEGAAGFQAKYGALSLAGAVKAAYGEIFGAPATDEKVAAILDGRVDYFAQYGQDGSDGLGAKAAAVGFLLVEAVKAGLGPYAQANARFLSDLAGGHASFNVDLLSAYGGSAAAPLESQLETTVALVGGADGGQAAEFGAWA